jgi:hypothetical protein
MNEVEESAQPNAFIPRPPLLEDWSIEKWANGVQVDELRELDVLSVETKHHTYEITVINPNTAEVMIRGGELFPEPVAAQVLGCSMGGSFLKVRGIYVGFRIELRVDERRVVTSPVRSVVVA